MADGSGKALTALADTWVAGDLDAAVAAGATLRPPGTLDVEASLPRIALRGADAEYELRGTLGEGGMAVVERAWQRTLGREVAIKHVPDASPAETGSMVREARIAGALEHPNIVPVHALGHDEQGRAVIVMKRVSGESWRALLDQPEHPLWGEGDRTLRNLEVLMTVCRAVELAHSRGWLHRDLKTDNVMLGEFGEVYVLDWGIAVPLDVAERGEAPFAGTPGYLAPEMAAQEPLSVRSDVFLLGGILHEVLTGESLHQGATLREVLEDALSDRTRTYPPSAPPELVEIARRATAFLPDDRFADVAAFRRALADFVVHRDALELTAVGETHRRSADGEGEARAALVEARATFRQALALWPEAARAREGLDATLRDLVDLELGEGNPPAARAWAAQLPTPDRALEARIRARQRELDAEAKELASLRDFAHDRDATAWAQLRRRRALGYGAVLTLLTVASGFALRAGWFELGYLEVGSLATISASAAVWSLIRGYRRQNLMSRWIADVAFAASLTPFPVLAATWRLGLPAETALALDLLVKAGGAVVLGVVVQPVFRWGALIHVLSAAAMLAFPHTFPLELAGGGLLLSLLVVARHADQPATTLAPPGEPPPSTIR